MLPFVCHPPTIHDETIHTDRLTTQTEDSQELELVLVRVFNMCSSPMHGIRISGTTRRQGLLFIYSLASPSANGEDVGWMGVYFLHTTRDTTDWLGGNGMHGRERITCWALSLMWECPDGLITKDPKLKLDPRQIFNQHDMACRFP